MTVIRFRNNDGQLDIERMKVNSIYYIQRMTVSYI